MQIRLHIKLQKSSTQEYTLLNYVILFIKLYMLYFIFNVAYSSKCLIKSKEWHNSYQITLSAKGLKVQMCQSVTLLLVVTLMKQKFKGQMIHFYLLNARVSVLEKRIKKSIPFLTFCYHTKGNPFCDPSTIPIIL